MRNPVDEYLETHSEKSAGFGGEVLQGMREGVDPKRLGGMLTGAAIAGGGALLTSAAHKAYMALTKSKQQKKMLEVNPDLAEHQANNPQMFSQHYSSLRSMNPRFAQDPVVAGAYMRRMSEFPHNAGPILVESLREQKSSGGGIKDFGSALDIAGSISGIPALKAQ